MSESFCWIIFGKVIRDRKIINVQKQMVTDKTKNLTPKREVLVRPQELESWTL